MCYGIGMREVDTWCMGEPLFIYNHWIKNIFKIMSG